MVKSARFVAAAASAEDGASPKLVAFVSALVVGDYEVASSILARMEVSGAKTAGLTKLVSTPFGGNKLHPLQAACGSRLPEPKVCAIVQRLIALGAPVGQPKWRDCSGMHTLLSKALATGKLKLAEILVAHGADVLAAMLDTDLLEVCLYDRAIVTWLLDHLWAGATATEDSKSRFRAAAAPLLARAAQQLYEMRQVRRMCVDGEGERARGETGRAHSPRVPWPG